MSITEILDEILQNYKGKKKYDSIGIYMPNIKIRLPDGTEDIWQMIDGKWRLIQEDKQWTFDALSNPARESEEE